MHRRDSNTPIRKSPDEIRRELAKLREESPADYAERSARLLAELERSMRDRTRFAKT
jgi:hypothetical protein